MAASWLLCSQVELFSVLHPLTRRPLSKFSFYPSPGAGLMLAEEILGSGGNSNSSQAAAVCKGSLPALETKLADKASCCRSIHPIASPPPLPSTLHAIGLFDFRSSEFLRLINCHFAGWTQATTLSTSNEKLFLRRVWKADPGKEEGIIV